jgi:homogentisate 1,2-dioxygenase
MLTLHPQGIHHGPQPRPSGAPRSVTHTDEVAVMLDTRTPSTPAPPPSASSARLLEELVAPEVNPHEGPVNPP